MKRRTEAMNDEKFIRQSYEMLIDQYGGRTIVISNQEVFLDKNAVKTARKKYPKTIPYIVTLPRKEFFSHHFLL